MKSFRSLEDWWVESAQHQASMARLERDSSMQQLRKRIGGQRPHGRDGTDARLDGSHLTWRRWRAASMSMHTLKQTDHTATPSIAALTVPICRSRSLATLAVLPTAPSLNQILLHSHTNPPPYRRLTTLWYTTAHAARGKLRREREMRCGWKARG
jgi:hypothetical protein